MFLVGFALKDRNQVHTNRRLPLFVDLMNCTTKALSQSHLLLRLLLLQKT
jgi:hypothetical protein